MPDYWTFDEHKCRSYHQVCSKSNHAETEARFPASSFARLLTSKAATTAMRDDATFVLHLVPRGCAVLARWPGLALLE